MSENHTLHFSTADWRDQIRKNTNHTRWVITIFFLIYLVLGILIDIMLYTKWDYNADPVQIFYGLITFKLFPYGTCVTLIIAALSLFITYLFYDRIMLLGTDYYEITPESARTPKEKQLYNVVEEMKVAAGLHFMPRVYVIEANYMNAFATGFSEKSALVAITKGLMEKLDREEMAAVMAHELSHVRHQDIKLTLTASVLTNIILMVIDILFYNLVFGRRDKVDGRLVLIVVLLRYLLPLITVLLMLYLSRTREYMADAGCVELMRDNQPLARALLKIHEDHQNNIEQYRNEYGKTAHEDVRRASYLYDPVKSGIEPVKSIASLFSTHPSLEKRLEAIGVKLEKK